METVLLGEASVSRSWAAVVAAVVMVWSSGAVAAASPQSDAYLAAVQAQGVPIYGAEYVVQLGRDVCRTAQTYPRMNEASLAMGEVTSEYEARPYQYSEAKVIVAAALSILCPEVR
ncbi:DUF732 domain-containing protein [Mycolicibacterium neoaurum]|nr:DUF732 domain-containing protein [Mycolicibacterium neoaurum]